METALNLTSSSLTFITIPVVTKPKSTTTNPDGFFPPVMRDLTPLKLSRFNLKYYHRRKIIHHPLNSLSHIKPVSLSPSIMAEEATERREIPRPPKAEEEERDKGRRPPKELPPPPEKPEPGDCCGSGCVRCVWDVYYDELDAYNQLLQQFNSQPISPSPKIENS